MPVTVDVAPQTSAWRSSKTNQAAVNAGRTVAPDVVERFPLAQLEELQRAYASPAPIIDPPQSLIGPHLSAVFDTHRRSRETSSHVEIHRT
jgi:hypothetical protein